MGEERWKEKVGHVGGDRKGDKTAAFLSRVRCISPWATRPDRVSHQPGCYSSVMQTPHQTLAHAHTHTHTHTHSLNRPVDAQLSIICSSNFHCVWAGAEGSGPIGDSLQYPIWHLKFISLLSAKTRNRHVSKRAHTHTRRRARARTQTLIDLWNLSGITTTNEIATTFIKNPLHYVYEKRSLCSCYFLTTCCKRVSLGVHAYVCMCLCGSAG